MINIDQIVETSNKVPLQDYPWSTSIDIALDWVKNKDDNYKAFIFDLLMSLSYVDATSGLESKLELCPNCPEPFNAHLPFINICSPCLESQNTWVHQKAAKPQSGALGKLSSEMILRFVWRLFPNFVNVYSVGGAEAIDAIIHIDNGLMIFAEVKCAPLITYPILFQVNVDGLEIHDKIVLTSSQLNNSQSAIYVHDNNFIPIGIKGHSRNWPFDVAVDFITNERNIGVVDKAKTTWLKAKEAYSSRNRDDSLYYLANASGRPPAIAKSRDGWPGSASISDSKTSAGLDRTDDIKKGIYQVLKIGTLAKGKSRVRTALISNLWAHRHGAEYLKPFENILWGVDSDLTSVGEHIVLKRNDLNYVFDLLITLENQLMRNLEL